MTACGGATAERPDEPLRFEDEESSTAPEGSRNTRIAEEHIARGEYQEAVAILEAEATTEGPAQARASFDLGLGYEGLGRAVEARAAYERATQLAPSFVQAWNNLGRLLHELDDSPGAIAALQHALDRQSENPTAHWNLALVLEDTGDIEGAESHYRSVISFLPQHFGARVNLGALLLERDGPDASRQVLLEAAEIGSSSWPDMLALGQALRLAGEARAGVAVLRSAIELAGDEGPAPIWFEYAATLFAAGDREQALRVLNEPVPQRDPYVHYLAGTLHAAMGATVAAIDAYQRFIESAPHHARRAEAERRVRFLRSRREP